MPEAPKDRLLSGIFAGGYGDCVALTPSPLLGRVDEMSRVRALVSGARNGAAGAVLLLGDPGVGKSTLLAEAQRLSSNSRVLPLAGFEAESDFAYGGLQRLGRMLGAQLDGLPPRQRDALLIAAGLSDGEPPTRPLVALASLSLLASASEADPLVILVDDAQHLDAESLGVLGFVARRLSAESVAMIFAARDDERVHVALAGVPSLRLEGLQASEVAELMARLTGAALDPSVVAALVASTGGNPLALTELALEADPQRLTLTAMAQSPAPIGRRLEAHYTSRVQELSSDARMWLLVAAAESAGDAGVVRAASARLGLAAAASGELEAQRLVEVRDAVRFRHPMIRAAVYNSTSDVDRRAVHVALRVETAARGFEEFSAWHAAAAAAGPDEELAEELVGLADRAATRGGLSSRARLLARAAELSPEPRRRDERLVAASEAAIGSGAARLALDLLSGVDIDALAPVVRGRFLFVRAMSGLFLGDAPSLLSGATMMLAAADSFGDDAPQLQQRALLHAFNFAQTAEHMMASVTVEELGRRFERGARAAPGPYAILLRALGSLTLDPYDVAVPRLREAQAMLESVDDATLLEFSFCSVVPAIALWDPDAAARVLGRTARAARERGAIREADAALWVLSAVELTRGNPARASNHMDQAAELRRAVGYADEQVVNAALLAWMGAPEATVQRIADAMAEAGWYGVWRMAAAALAIGDIADGRFPEAYARLSSLVSRPFLHTGFHQLTEFVEAAAKSGHRDEAEVVAERVRRFAQDCASPWAMAMAERCAALLAEGVDAERHYVASLHHLAATGMVGELGRAQLMYGEWLRRSRRRRDARDHLREAAELLVRVGAMRFAERARRELVALGDTPADAERPASALTAQETVIAQLAADGATNAEIGAALFISRNTVDYHLRKIFRKLGVSSRRQLADATRRS